MLTLELVVSNDYRYSAVCEFSRENYIKTLKINLVKYPDLFICLFENEKVVGCMGLNNKIKSPLFSTDWNLLQILNKQSSNKTCAEQSVFIIESKPYGIPILIAATARYGYHLGIQNIVYAGISVSIKTIAKLGFKTTMVGKTSLDLLDKKNKVNYSYWHNLHNPITYILSTNKSVSIFEDTMNRFGKKILCGPNLNSVFTLGNSTMTGTHHS